MSKELDEYAFPQGDVNLGGCDGGVTLRDYFASRAIVECIRVAEHQTPQTIREPMLSALFDKAATYAYFVADAMLKARQS